MQLHLEGVPCPRRAIRAHLADSANMELILERGLGMTPWTPMESEVWKAMDDILQLPDDLGRYLMDVHSDARSWYRSEHKCFSVYMWGHLTGYLIPMGLTLDETVKIMSGCRKYLLLRIWRQVKGEVDHREKHFGGPEQSSLYGDGTAER